MNQRAKGANGAVLGTFLIQNQKKCVGFSSQEKAEYTSRIIADRIRRKASQREYQKLAKNLQGVAEVVVQKVKTVIEFRSLKV